ncbi:MAG: cytochrome-c peroxidase [Gammaproteobacteria bacterium]
MNKLFVLCVLCGFVSSIVNSASAESLTPLQQLGQRLYRDKHLSLNRNQSCATCHSLAPVTLKAPLPALPAPGFVDPANVRNGTPVSKGSVSGARGTLNAPSVGYAAFSPFFHWDSSEGLYVGGQFWNGRAATLAAQAQKPFLNPAEMAMPSRWAVVSRLRESLNYVNIFQKLFGLDLLAIPSYQKSQPEPPGVRETYSAMARAIGAFEKSRVFNKFNSKFDFVLAGVTAFSPIEARGFKLFNNKALCSACHVSEATIAPDGSVFPPLFTDFTYDNIGLPRNVNIPYNPEPDKGLGGRSGIAKRDPNGEQLGKHKVMSLRNIALTPPYGHNGVLKTLQQVVHFYNTRDTLGQVADNNDPGFGVTGWPEPEVAQNVNNGELGNLQLSAAEETAIVAFLKTLTDDYPEWGGDPNVPPGTASPFAETPFPPMP